MKCIILTDINGLPTEETCFLSGSDRLLSIERIGLAQLLGISCHGEDLHRALVEGGFDVAAAKALDLFKEADLGVGYSSGGAVLWKSVLCGLQLQRLVCISSTRLRDEDPNRIVIPTLTDFGGRDAARPPASWGTGGNLHVLHLPQAEHAFYGSMEADWRKCRETVLDFLQLNGIKA
jgi:hypothetical protein